jgi:hypothetical protein
MNNTGLKVEKMEKDDIEIDELDEESQKAMRCILSWKSFKI